MIDRIITVIRVSVVAWFIAIMHIPLVATTVQRKIMVSVVIVVTPLMI